jgi:hypothetical protein
MARTAVIAGTATATANAVNRRQASKNVAAYDQAQQQYYQSQASYQTPGYQPPAQQQPVYEEAAAPSMDEKIEQLERLAQLKAQGILTDEEFAAQKAKLLNS